jgi:hypothetical protein
MGLAAPASGEMTGVVWLEVCTVVFLGIHSITTESSPLASPTLPLHRGVGLDK